MLCDNFLSTLVSFLLLIILVVEISMISESIWGGTDEELPEPDELILNNEMTVEQFGQVNELPNNALKAIFGLETKTELQKKISDYGTPKEVRSLVRRKVALVAEQSSKNWIKIVIKFIFWFGFLSAVYFYLDKNSITNEIRKGLLFASVCIFGVILGSDPGAMGTVKDAIHLFAHSGAVFVPRMIALLVFLVIVFLANKYICAWGCQAGTLQDLIFRLNRDKDHNPVIWKQFKIPFAVTNTIRIGFFLLFTFGAFLWGADIIDPIDIFKIYNPARIGLLGGVVIGAFLISSLFVYRPWCHFLCPFGLISWLIEKKSVTKIRVDYEHCIACHKCVKACPSTVMSAILYKDKKTIPDCFACYTCEQVCPTGAVQFSRGKRTQPPPDLFQTVTIDSEPQSSSEILENDKHNAPDFSEYSF